MVCKKCGFENIEESMFCNKCGARLEQTNDEILYNNEMNKNIIENKDIDIDSIKRKKFINKIIKKISIKNKTFVITITAVFIIAVVLGLFYSYNKDVSTFKSLFNNKEYSQAQKYYSDVIKNLGESKKGKMDNSIKNYFIDKATQIKEGYIKDTKYDYNNEVAILNNMVSYNLGDNEIKLIKDYIIKVGDSRNSYYKGTEALKNNDYMTATVNFQKVVEDDSNYNEVQGKLKEILPELKKQQIESSEKLFQSKDYDKAISSIQIISQYFDNDEELNNKLTLYKSEKEKQGKLIVQQKESRKNELLSYVNKYTDKVSNEIMYSPKPYGDKLNIPLNGVIFYPYLRGEIGSDVFKLIAGFNREEWVFIKKIVCNADGIIFEINFSYFDRESDVGIGTGIDEWVEIPSFDTISTTSDQNPKLLENLNKLGKASNALIKFQGDTKSFDYTLTQEQKNTLLNMIELHNVSKH